LEVKLSLLHKHINEQNLSHFPSCKNVSEFSTSSGNQTLKDRFAGITQELQNIFPSQFTDFHTRTSEIRSFQNSFAFGTHQDPVHMSMEKNKLENNDT
jgi:hypothetical protein